MKINYNTSALIANNALQNNDNLLSESLKRLSSGLKIAEAKDNPSGLAIARRMNAQIKSLDVAGDSSQDGISIVETVDGVLGEIHDMLQRMNELAVKASNGTLTQEDREMVQDEIRSMKEEIQRVADTTQFNGQNLLDGSFDYRGYATVGTDPKTAETDPKIKVSTFSDDVPLGNVTVTGLSATYDDKTNSLTMTDAQKAAVTVTDSEGNSDYTVTKVDGDLITLANNKGMSIQIKSDKTLTGDQLNLEITHKGTMTKQVGANEGQVLDIRIPEISLSHLGIFNTDVSYHDETAVPPITSEESARKAIDQVKSALAYVTAARSRLGAYQNRLEHTSSNIDVTSENMTASYSRIMDVDMAEEMTTYSTQQILSQAGISMLSQANERPSQVLQLLQ